MSLQFRFFPSFVSPARKQASAAEAIPPRELGRALEEAYLQTVLALGKAVQAKDDYTAHHTAQVVCWTERVARKLGVSDPAKLLALRFGAQLHDLGKIGIPDKVLNKPGPLVAAEWRLMRQHPAIGGKILEDVPYLKGAADIVRHHHEWWDGTGYPDRLAGEAIPLGARIVAVVDAYSAILDRRVYKPGRPPARALLELERAAGRQFDPTIVRAFREILEEDGIVAGVEGGLPQDVDELTRRRKKGIWSFAPFKL